MQEDHLDAGTTDLTQMAQVLPGTTAFHTLYQNQVVPVRSVQRSLGEPSTSPVAVAVVVLSTTSNTVLVLTSSDAVAVADKVRLTHRDVVKVQPPVFWRNGERGYFDSHRLESTHHEATFAFFPGGIGKATEEFNMTVDCIVLDGQIHPKLSVHRREHAGYSAVTGTFIAILHGDHTRSRNVIRTEVEIERALFVVFFHETDLSTPVLARQAVLRTDTQVDDPMTIGEFSIFTQESPRIAPVSFGNKEYAILRGSPDGTRGFPHVGISTLVGEGFVHTHQRRERSTLYLLRDAIR
ncbi:hypothetical protein [Pseudomonas phage vB_PaeP_YL1]